MHCTPKGRSRLHPVFKWRLLLIFIRAILALSLQCLIVLRNDKRFTMTEVFLTGSLYMLLMTKDDKYNPTTSSKVYIE